ncbi:oligosaccharide flippase family protein [Moorellaceae bacterium AZ2]
MLLRHSAIYLLARGLPGAINFLAIAIYTRLLSPENYGRYALVIAGVGFFNVVFFGWLGLSLARFLPAHLGNPQRLLSAIFTAFVALALFTGGVGILLAWFWPDPTWRALIAIAVPLLWAQAWFEINLELARSKLAPVRYGFLSMVKAATALGLGTFLVLWGVGVYGPLLGFLAGMLLAGVGLSLREWEGVYFGRFMELRVLLSYGLPLTAAFLLNFVVNTSDRFLIAWLVSEAAAGVYAAGYDLAQQSIGVIMAVINLAAYPLVVRTLEARGKEAAFTQLRRNASLFVSVAVPAATGFAVLSPNIAHVLLGANYREPATAIMPWIAAAILISGLRSHYLDLSFQLARRTSAQVLVLGVAALVNLGLNLLWIPALGILGAAYATLAAFVAALGVSAWFGKRLFPIPIPYSDGLKVALASALMVVVLWPLRSHVGLGPLVFQIFTGIVAYIVAFVGLNASRIRTLILQVVYCMKERV